MASGLDQFLGKLEATNEIGESLTKQLQLAEEEVQQFIGGGKAFKLGADKVGALGAHVDKDLEEGKLSFASELAAAAYIKKYIARASEVLLNLKDGAKNQEMVASGKVVALRSSAEIVMKHCIAAKTRAEQIRQALAEAASIAQGGPVDPDRLGEVRTPRGARAPGEHPGRSALDGRRQAAAVDHARTTQKEPPRKKRAYKKRAKKVSSEG